MKQVEVVTKAWFDLYFEVVSHVNQDVEKINNCLFRFAHVEVSCDKAKGFSLPPPTHFQLKISFGRPIKGQAKDKMNREPFLSF